MGASTLLALPLQAAFDRQLVCEKSFDQRLEAALEKLDALEVDYLRYRWAESRLRHLYYGPLWQARHEALDPFSEERRSLAEQSEGRLLDEKRRLESQALSASNGLVQKIRELQQADLDFVKSSPEKDFEACIQESITPFYRHLSEIQQHFEHVFERERQARQAVFAASGGRDGLYPQNTLEDPSEHSDYYERFVMAEEPNRFNEDGKTIHDLWEARKMLTWDPRSRSCCRQDPA